MTLSAMNGILRTPLRNVFFVLILTILSHSSTVAYGAKNIPAAFFKPGEKLTYRATWGVITAGELVMEVLPMETIQGIKAYHFAMITKTNGVVDLIYKVRQREESYIDAGMTHSILYKKQSEGKHPRDVVINFNWQELEATRYDFGKKNEPIRILPGSFDPLALFFILRLQDFKENSLLEIPVTDGKKNIVMRAAVAKKTTIRVDGKKYDSFEVTPDMESLEGVVKRSDEPRLKIWFTADGKKIPSRIQMRVGSLSLVFELTSIELPS